MLICTTGFDLATPVLWVALVMGLLIGSFLTVVIDRVPRGASIVQPGSACGTCGLELGPLDLVPVMSWIVLRGKCRKCRQPIGVEPIVVEIVTAALFVLMAIHFESGVLVAAFCVFAAGLTGLTVIDLKTQRLPREVTYTVMALGAPLLVIAALIENEPRRIYMALIGAAISLAVMGALYIASRGGLGDGDVRLSPLLGMYLGWLNPGLALVGLFYGFILGAVIGVAMMIIGKAGRRTQLPFGPFLAAGSIVAIFYGQNLIDMVLGH
jgi:leader peptidase (prepilin peptidase)/N-methyltransferase